MAKTVKILDMGYDKSGNRVLLDGYGKPLPEGGEPVYLEFAGEACDYGTANSAGQLFDPPMKPEGYRWN